MSNCAPAQPMQVKEAYRLWAPLYDETPNPLLSLEQRALLPLLASASGCDVVDIGCGTGRWLTKLAEIRVRSLTGIDLSEEMLERAATKVNSAAQLIRADCLNTTLAESSSDWMLASFLLSYVGDIKGFAREIARIARPGAVVLVSDVHPATRNYGWKRTFRCGEQEIEIQTHRYQISDLQREMEVAGFESMFFREIAFGEEEKKIFVSAGRLDLFMHVDTLPVVMIAGYRRSMK
jgi:ubiquinone/menaquinone biosynthesis C-methylase UbiE